MKKIVRFYLELFDNKMQKWLLIDKTRLQYCEEKEIYREYNYKDFCNQILNNNKEYWEHNCFYVRKTLFKKNVVLYDRRTICGIIEYKEKDFQNLKFRITTEESKNVTLKEIMDELPYQEFKEFVKDIGLDILYK